MDDSKEKVVPINKNREPEIDSIEFMCKQLESFPTLERAILELTLGLGETFKRPHSIDQINKNIFASYRQKHGFLSLKIK